MLAVLTRDRPLEQKEETLENTPPKKKWLGRLAMLLAALALALFTGKLFLAQADGPVSIFRGGPFETGEQTAFAEMKWQALDTLHELEMEIVDAETSLTLWFSVHDGVPYVACDLDCFDGKLDRWPQMIERDGQVVMRIDGKRVDGRLVHVAHGTEEYSAVREGRNLKYSGDGGGRAASETAAHSAVVGVGETLTGRAGRAEPGDRLYRMDRR
jgi:hypothetical protein